MKRNLPASSGGPTVKPREAGPRTGTPGSLLTTISTRICRDSIIIKFEVQGIMRVLYGTCSPLSTGLQSFLELSSFSNHVISFERSFFPDSSRFRLVCSSFLKKISQMQASQSLLFVKVLFVSIRLLLFHKIPFARFDALFRPVCSCFWISVSFGLVRSSLPNSPLIKICKTLRAAVSLYSSFLFRPVTQLC